MIGSYSLHFVESRSLEWRVPHSGGDGMNQIRFAGEWVTEMRFVASFPAEIGRTERGTEGATGSDVRRLRKVLSGKLFL